MIELKVDLKSLENVLGKKARSVIRQAVVRTMNRALSQATTEAKREISKKLNVKQKDIKTRIDVTRATARNPKASIQIADRKLPLVFFNPRREEVLTSRGPRIGVSVVINGVRQLVEGAFLAEVRSGKLGIWKRVGRARLPIRQQFHSRLSELINTRELTSRLNKVIVDSVNKNLQANLSFYIERAKK